MNDMDNTRELEKHEGCSGGACSAADSSNKVEKVAEGSQERRAYAPAVDIVDGNDATTLVLDLPGVDEKDVDITIEKSILTLRATQKDSSFTEHNLAYSEYGTGDYQRSFALSDEVDRDNIKATLKDGVLKLRLPKSQPVSKKITVGASS